MSDRPHATRSPETWSAARRAIARARGAFERLVEGEAASGVVLLAAALIAFIWSNSPWGSSYEQVFRTPLTIGLAVHTPAESIRFWINDGAMVVFFLSVGLEIRREIHDGELSDPKRAVLPVAAALGGMFVPAIIYLLVNGSGPSRRGWAVPMATDIAFAVGVLALLGRRVPAGLRMLLLALAIIDDVGAIVVIAIFYSSGISGGGLLLAAVGIALVLLLRRLGVRSAVGYVPPGALVWFGFLRAGVHPAIAGVVLGLLTPARRGFGARGFRFTSRRWSDEARPLARAPVVTLERLLHPWVTFGIMPLFALANAGVDVRGMDFEAASTAPVMVGIALGLLVGKPVGILAASYATVRLGIAALPRGMTWSGVAVVGCVAGIGFTMAIFIAGLAFPGSALLGAAKVAILAGSTTAALLGIALGRSVLRTPPGAADTAEEAESSHPH